MSRDNARTPMQWDAGPYAGFSEAGSWMAVNPNYPWLNFGSESAAPDSVFAHYRALIRLRHQLPILVRGDFTPLMAEDPQIWAYTRTSPTDGLVVLANCGRESRTIDIGPEWLGARLLLGNLQDAAVTITSTSLDLGPWDARMYFAD